MPSSELKIKKYRLERHKEQYKKRSSRRLNFTKLKNGLIEKYINDDLDLKDRQLDSILKLVDPKTDETAISQGYFHACTAFGKTYLMIALAESYRYIEPNKKIIILEESTKVLEQKKKDFIEKTNFNEDDIGAYYGKEKTPSSPIITCTYASMEKMLNEVGQENIGLVLCDEAHHILSQNRQRVAQAFSHACLYGFTATPEYDKDRDCANVFGKTIDSVTLREGVENGLLCSFKNSLMVSRTAVDLTDAKNSSGDYDPEKLSEILKQSHLTGIREEIANFYLFGEDASIGKLKGKTTIINTPNQEEANELAKTFNVKAGKQIAKAYHTNSDESVLDEFNQGNFPVLIQVNRISEGYSNPKAEICFNYPTSSKVRSAQCGGRVLRSNKENPDKLALIVDICFKKTDSSSVLDEIRANGQVLFMDIAEDVAIIHKDLQRNLNTQKTHHSAEKTSNYIPKLFETYTNIEDIYNMRFNQMLSDNSATPSREKLDTDLTWILFLQNIPLTQKGNTIAIGSKDKEKTRQYIWQQALKEYPNLFIKVKAGSRTIDVVPKENIIEFKKFLKTQGIEIPNQIREKLNTDLTRILFLQKIPLTQKGNTIATGFSDKEKIRLSIWQQALNELPELFIKVKAGTLTIDAVPKENIIEFKKFLKTQGIEIPNQIREKLDTDLGLKYFFEKLPLTKNGNTLAKGSSDKEKIRQFIWQQALNEHPELFIKVKTGNLTIDIIPEENLIEFKNFLKTQGIEIPNQIREKLDTDLGLAYFLGKLPLTQNGNTVTKGANDKEKIRQSVWQQALTEHPNLFIKVKAGSKTIDVIPEENLIEFKNFLKTQGIEIPNQIREKLDTDLGLKYFSEKIPLTQNGNTIATGSGDKEKIRQFIWQQALNEHPEFFIKVKAGPKTIDIISEENLSNFIDYLKSKDITLTISKDELLKKIKQNSNKQKTPIPLTKGRDF